MPDPSPLSTRHSPLRWLVPAAKLAIVALLVWGLHRTLTEAYHDLRNQTDAQAQSGRPAVHLEPLWLAVSGGLYLLGMLPSGLFWHRVLRVLGQPVGWFTAIRAYYIGHLGKYVPGKALVVVLRAGLVRGREVNTFVAAVSVFIETLTMMASGSLLAAVLILCLYPGEYLWLWVIAALGMTLVAGVPTLPPVFKRLIRWMPIGRASPEAIARLHQIDYGTLALGWLATGVGWIVMGLSLGATLRGMGVTTPGLLDGLPLTTTIVCVSVVAGFISFIPGGLGSARLVMARLISEPQLGAGVAVVSVIVLRIVWLVAELIVAGALYVIRRRSVV